MHENNMLESANIIDINGLKSIFAVIAYKASPQVMAAVIMAAIKTDSGVYKTVTHVTLQL